MPRTTFAPARRRRSPMPTILLILFVLIVGGAIYLSTVGTEVPTHRIEQDVTGAAQSK
jgi:hypothetical protein